MSALIGLASKSNDVEASQRLFELQRLLIQQQQDLYEKQVRIQELENEVKALTGKLTLGGQLLRVGDLIWVKPKGGGANGPYCPICYGADNRLILVRLLSDFREKCKLGQSLDWWCDLHQAHFGATYNKLVENNIDLSQY
ncbi:MAG: hypothetical protein J0L64_03605 [Acidobacteria bacterium]|nr:hypothetical protein [Acidobacteriota bacterium]